MKIAIDISPVVYGIGVSVYTENLVRNLFSIDKSNDYVLFGGSLRRREEIKDFFHTLKVSDPGGSMARKGASFKGKVFPLAPTLADIIWNKLHIAPIELFTGKVDVFHSSDWAQPPAGAFKVTTVHDLSPIKFPRVTHPTIVSAHKARLTWVKKEVDRVIVPSSATKDDLVVYGISQERIRVIPEAPSPIFKVAKKSEIERLKKKYRISGKYLLAVGLNPRKNTQRIIEAFDFVKAGEDLKLVLVGEPSFLEIKEQRDVRIVGHVSPQMMPVFYSGAEALVYPSIYEGFGLPILEAFVCDCPVVVSNISSMPEVAGDSAVMVDPYDVNSIVDGIKTVLKARKVFARKGSFQVKKYSWKKTASETLKVYEEAYKR